MRNLDVDIKMPDPILDETSKEVTIPYLVKVPHHPCDFQICINWSDGHVSTFKPRFLKKYGPNGTSGDLNGHSDRMEPILWDSSHKIRQHEFDEIMSTESALYALLEGKGRDGLLLI